MRVLFLTNFYPPASLGGYEQWCQEVAEGFLDRGHCISVLTSNYKRQLVNDLAPDWIHRKLNLEMEFTSLRNSIHFFSTRKSRERKNLVVLQHQIETFQPDCILVWGMWNLPRSLPVLAEKLMPARVVYYMGDYWPTLPSQWEQYWQAPANHWFTAIPKKLLRSLAIQKLGLMNLPKLSFSHVLTPTSFMLEELKRQGIHPENSKIINGAINTRMYSSPANLPGSTTPKPHSLLYAGRLSPEKGVEIALEAVAILVNHHKQENIKLSVVGTGERSYEAHLHKFVQQRNIDRFVEFLGSQPKEKMPIIYQQADILLFTSIWPEPFGRVIVEAMASGIAVIGSSVGGATELLRDEDTALCFPVGDATALAEKINRLVNDPNLYQSICKNGYDTATKLYDIQTMTNQIENYLQSIIAS